VVAEVGGGDGRVDADRLGHRIEGQSGEPDEGGQACSPKQVPGRLAEVEADQPVCRAAGRAARAGSAREQVEGEEGRQHPEGDAGDLIREVEPGPVGGDRGVQGARLLAERDLASEALDDPQQAPDRGGAERDAEHQRSLDEQ
jgi:hypothetical protein